MVSKTKITALVILMIVLLFAFLVDRYMPSEEESLEKWEEIKN